MRSKQPACAQPRPLSFVLLTPPRGGAPPVPPEFASLTPPTANLTHFTVTALPPTANGVIVKYSTLPGNLAKLYGNTLALWDSTIPNTGGPPLATAMIPDNSEVGDVFIPYGFQQSNYSVTYQTKGMSTMCALAPIQLALAAMPTYVSITISSLDSSSVKVIYSTLPGYTPATYKNWIGLWQGFESPYSNGSPLAQATITQDYTQGEVTIPFSPGPFDYTLIYFMGVDRPTAGALLYFRATTASDAARPPLQQKHR